MGAVLEPGHGGETLQRYWDQWRRSDDYRRTVAQRVRTALEGAGVTPRDIGAVDLEEALCRYDVPLTVAQISAVAAFLACSPVPWMAA